MNTEEVNFDLMNESEIELFKELTEYEKKYGIPEPKDEIDEDYFSQGIE